MYQEEQNVSFYQEYSPDTQGSTTSATGNVVLQEYLIFVKRRRVASDQNWRIVFWL